MTKQELIKNLENQISLAQQSERWVMYRLINPIVDYACGLTGQLPYFEYPQAKDTPASEKIDIGIFDNFNPKIFIEAKKLRKKIDPDLITHYLKDHIIGIVSNGYNWIIAIKKDSSFEYSYLTIFKDEKIDLSNLDLLISVLTNQNTEMLLLQKSFNWRKDKIEIGNNLKTFIPPYQKAAKIYHEHKNFDKPDEAKKFIQDFEHISDIQNSFCFNFLDEIENKKENLYFKIRKSRLSWFSPYKRLGRIEFNGEKGSILVATEIVEANPQLDRIIASKVHSKHRGMRVYDIFDEKTAAIFGKELGKIIKRL